jgi:hypothetical protein
MGSGRRLAVLLIALALIGVPAAALRVGCVGASCRSSAAAATPAPFCALPADLRALITAGTYEGRSPDVLGVAGSTPLTSDVGAGVRVPWPSDDQARASTVPLLFLGSEIHTGELASTLGLDQIAPTLEPLFGLSRPHPEVRSGSAIPGVTIPGRTTPLVVVIVWKSLGISDIANGDTPWFGRTSSRPGSTNEPRPGEPGIAGGLATAGSLPLDPTAVETTIGAGGIPSQHGITGTWVRNTRGRLTRAFGAGAPPSVIAGLGDDLDQATGGRTLIGLIRSSAGDTGLTGDAWYGTGPVLDTVIHAGSDIPAQVADFLTQGWGRDGTPDLLAVPLSGGASTDDRTTSRIVDEVLRAVPDATVVVTATGSLTAPRALDAGPPPGVALPSRGVAAGGFFVDRSAGTTTTAQDVVDAMRAQTGPDGAPLYTDAFASYAVRFGRYC